MKKILNVLAALALVGCVGITSAGEIPAGSVRIKIINKSPGVIFRKVGFKVNGRYESSFSLSPAVHESKKVPGYELQKGITYTGYIKNPNVVDPRTLSNGSNQDIGIMYGEDYDDGRTRPHLCSTWIKGKVAYLEVVIEDGCRVIAHEDPSSF